MLTATQHLARPSPAISLAAAPENPKRLFALTAVIGSSLHKLAFPDFFKKHVHNKYLLQHAHEHPGIDIGDKIRNPFKKAKVHQVQARGEYLYAACGEAGVRVFDIAFIDNKSTTPLKSRETLVSAAGTLSWMAL